MSTVLYILAPIIMAIGMTLVFAFARRERVRKNDNLNRRDFVIRSTYSWGIIMITLDVILALILILGNIEKPFSVGVNIVLGLLFVLFGFGILQAFRERVRVKDSDILFTPAVGKTKSYTFKDIETVERRKTGIYVYVNGKKAFNLDPSGIGTSLFIELYSIYHKNIEE